MHCVEWPDKELRSMHFRTPSHWGLLLLKRSNMVGVVELESTTFCSQSRRATRLRYTPKNGTPRRT